MKSLQLSWSLSSSLLWLLFSCHYSDVSAQSAAAGCEPDCCVPCEGGSLPDPSADIEGISCRAWETVNSLAGGSSDECYRQRMIGQHYCGCPSDEIGVCQCPAGTELFEGTMNVLEGTQLTCEAAAWLPAIDGEESCRVFVNSCCNTIGNMDGTCTLCKVRGNIPNQFERRVFGRWQQGTGRVTCGELARGPVLGDVDCHTEHFNSTIDEAAYCGCPRIDPPNTCSVCPLNQDILQETAGVELNAEAVSGTILRGEIPDDRAATCRDIGDIAPFVVDSGVCRSLRLLSIDSNCCGYEADNVPRYQPPVPDNNAPGDTTPSGATIAATTKTVGAVVSVFVYCFVSLVF